jgi:CDP-glycerol glycerophosphotransferase (TagB/SpsB family)
MISDILFGDTSSIIAEFCALDKPIITFRVPEAGRSIPEIREMIKSISIQIDNFDEVYDAIKRCLENPNEKSAQREAANKIMFGNLDGKAGKRAAREIEKLLKEKNLI